jgi:phosphonate transport system substrate-binding protein
LNVPSLAQESYSFGVIAQRSPTLTAQYWNPILDYVSRRADVKLELQVARSGDLSSDAVVRGDYDFAYSNHQFKPSAAAQGYAVILRSRGEDIAAQLVTLESSPARSVADLQEKAVGFANPQAFAGYTVPMDYLQRSGVKVSPVFGGNQEGIMAQLKAGNVFAAGVNSVIMKDYAAREGVRYRVLWQSESFRDLAISVHQRVPAEVARRVARAFVDMTQDASGMKVLEASAGIINQKPPLGFVAANQRDYQSYVDFYLHNVFKGAQ